MLKKILPPCQAKTDLLKNSKITSKNQFPQKIQNQIHKKHKHPSILDHLDLKNVNSNFSKKEVKKLLQKLLENSPIIDLFEHELPDQVMVDILKYYCGEEDLMVLEGSDKLVYLNMEHLGRWGRPCDQVTLFLFNYYQSTKS